MSLPTKVHIVKATVFPVVTYGCESWTIKKAEHRRINAFELWYWRRLLRVLWTESRSVNPKGNQLWIFIGRTDAEASILWLPDAKSWLTGKDLMLGMIEDTGEKGQHSIRWLDGTIDSMDMNLSKLWEIGKGREVHGVAKSQRTWLNDWTITTSCWPQTLGKVEHANQILKRALVKLCLGPLFQMYAITPCTHLGHGIAFQIKGENSFMPWNQQHLAIFTPPVTSVMPLESLISLLTNIPWVVFPIFFKKNRSVSNRRVCGRTGQFTMYSNLQHWN